MALKKKMTANEMINFIDNELLPQIKLEIQKLIHPKKEQGGYFVVTRQILCMVDFLGALYSGYTRNDRRNDKRGKNIATSKKAIKFIMDFFEPKTIYEAKVVDQLYNMYRHGLVHLYQPKFLKINSKKILLWFFYKGNSNRKRIKVGTNEGIKEFKNISHLKETPHYSKKKYFYLPICIDSLYNDFENAVQKYKAKLKYLKYQRRWRSTVNAICKPR